MIKRFLLFAGESYYPQGGLDDLLGSYDTLADAVQALNDRPDGSDEWAEVLDTALGGRIDLCLTAKSGPCRWQAQPIEDL